MGRPKPQFAGQRLTLFDWQFTQLDRMLGRHAGEFDSFAFVADLDQQLAQSGEVLPPQGEMQAFLEEALFREAARRGLPIMNRRPLGKLSGRMQAALMSKLKQS